jgi:hypothetical protein
MSAHWIVKPVVNHAVRCQNALSAVTMVPFIPTENSPLTPIRPFRFTHLS